MPTLHTHLNFNGNCREAMHFYQQCLDAQVDFLPFSKTPCNVPDDQRDKIAHARLSKGPLSLMACDAQSSQQLQQGNNFCVAVQCDSVPELEKLFTAFSQGATITLPLQDMFWGARFGMLTDRFGINWMFNCEMTKSN